MDSCDTCVRRDACPAEVYAECCSGTLDHYEPRRPLPSGRPAAHTPAPLPRAESDGEDAGGTSEPGGASGAPERSCETCGRASCRDAGATAVCCHWHLESPATMAATISGLPTDRELVDILADALGTDESYRERLDALTMAKLVAEHLDSVCARASELEARLADLGRLHSDTLDRLHEVERRDLDRERRLTAALERACACGAWRGPSVPDEVVESVRRAARACEVWARGGSE